MKSVVFTLYLSVLQMIREIYCILSMFLVVGKISNKKSKWAPAGAGGGVGAGGGGGDFWDSIGNVIEENT